jgi:hypothetical protein
LGTRSTDARLWRGAQSFAELCALGARFVTGELRAFPGWGRESLDEESRPLVPVLELCNRAGLLTLASQPGCAQRMDSEGRVGSQRAFVVGFANEAAVSALRSITRADLMVVTHAPGARMGAAVETGRSGDEPCLWGGHAAAREELRLFRPVLSHAALRELEAQSLAWAIDLAWEERDDLWRDLREALGPLVDIRETDGRPHTHPELT